MAKHFREFVSDKDKGKAPVKVIADYPGPFKNNPPDGGKPYAAAGKGGKATKGGKVGSDWTDLGDKSLVYEPKTAHDDKKKDCGKSKCVDSVKEFVNKTKSMNDKEFAEYIAATSVNSGVVHESIHKTCKVLSENSVKVDDLIRELRRVGLLENVVASLFSIPEAHKMIMELVGPPMHGTHHIHPSHPANKSLMHNAMQGDMGMGGDMGAPGMPHPHDPNDTISPEDMEDDENLHDLDPDSMGLDDEESDGLDMNPHSMPAPHSSIPGRPQDPGHDFPRPSMMARMMQRH